jgi:hypothetical protein
LDVSTGRVYIYCDVVFDETVYPFSKLHPNAGARLHDEISLLPNCDHDGVCLAANDSVLINSSNQLDEITTSCSYPGVGGEEIRENGEEINADLGEDCSSPKRHHMSNPGIVIEEDSGHVSTSDQVPADSTRGSDQVQGDKIPLGVRVCRVLLE